MIRHLALCRSLRVRPWLFVVAIHVLVGYNAVVHPPYINYDASGHLSNLEQYSRLRFPTPLESDEFFSPPLPYIGPALVKHFGLVTTTGMWKLAQAQNVLLSLLLCWQLLRLCRAVRPNDPTFSSWALAFLAMMPVYYKSFAFIRGEPWIAALGVVAAFETLRLASEGASSVLTGTLRLGVLCGLLILSRQWAFFVVAALVGFLLVSQIRNAGVFRSVRICAATLAIAAVVGGWFYLRLSTEHGSLTAFNRERAGRFALSNQPKSFYLGLGLPEVFTHPFRRSFVNQLLPTFFSEFWGDWEEYFLVYGKDLRGGRYYSAISLQPEFSQQPRPQWLETNLPAMNRYVGTGQLLAVFPSLFMLGGVIWGLFAFARWLRRSSGDSKAEPGASQALSTLIVLVSFAGYFVFLVLYPSPFNGNTIKATYMLQTYPFLAFLAALWAVRLAERWPTVMRWAQVALLLVGFHNLGLCFTRFHGPSDPGPARLLAPAHAHLDQSWPLGRDTEVGGDRDADRPTRVGTTTSHTRVQPVWSSPCARVAGFALSSQPTTAATHGCCDGPGQDASQAAALRRLQHDARASKQGTPPRLGPRTK